MGEGGGEERQSGTGGGRSVDSDDSKFSPHFSCQNPQGETIGFLCVLTDLIFSFYF